MDSRGHRGTKPHEYIPPPLLQKDGGRGHSVLLLISSIALAMVLFLSPQITECFTCITTVLCLPSPPAHVIPFGRSCLHTSSPELFRVLVLTVDAVQSQPAKGCAAEPQWEPFSKVGYSVRF